MSSPYKFSEWTYVDKAIAENHHICTRCHSDITSDHIEKPVLITYDGDNVEYICPDCTADFFFYSLGKTLEARGARASFLFAVNISDTIYSRSTLDKRIVLCYNQPRGGGGRGRKGKKKEISLNISLLPI